MAYVKVFTRLCFCDWNQSAYSVMQRTRKISVISLKLQKDKFKKTKNEINNHFKENIPYNI